jgi:hypothetical protein
MSFVVSSRTYVHASPPSYSLLETINTWNAMLEHQGRDELRVIGDDEWRTDWEVGHICADF